MVGPDLIMTNRHVARLFAEGLGVRKLVFRAGDAAIDFKCEQGSPEDDQRTTLQVEEVVSGSTPTGTWRCCGSPASRRRRPR